MIIRCPRCKQALRVHTTVSAWDHITKHHPDWMRDLFRLPDDDTEAAIKKELHAAFPGIEG